MIDSPETQRTQEVIGVTPEMVEAGVLMVRNWMDENWSTIQEGGEPCLPHLVEGVLSLARIRECPHPQSH